MVGGQVRGTLEEAQEKDLIEDLDTKVVGYFRAIKAVAPIMRAQKWGRIISIGGVSARQSTIYGLRNAAVVHMTKTLSDQAGRGRHHPQRGASRADALGSHREQAGRAGGSARRIHRGRPQLGFAKRCHRTPHRPARAGVADRLSGVAESGMHNRRNHSGGRRREGRGASVGKRQIPSSLMGLGARLSCLGARASRPQTALARVTRALTLSHKGLHGQVCPETGFKALKSVGWQRRKTRLTDPARVERHRLVLSVATPLALAFGSRMEDANALKRDPSRAAGAAESDA